MFRRVYFALLGVVLLSLPLSAAGAPRTKQPPRVNADAAVMSDFLKRVDGYVALHKKLEDTLPKLPTQTTPEQIDAHQRALARLIQEAQKSAKQGEILTPAMQRVIRNLLRPIFSGVAGQQIKNEIMDKEFRAKVPLKVNGRYPDEVPISTVPPQVLAALPKLPEEIEYRFIQNGLILFDPHSHLIVDFMHRAFN